MTFQYTFNNPAVYITENGFSQVGPLQIEDVQRSEFYKDTILEVAKGKFALDIYIGAKQIAIRVQANGTNDYENIILIQHLDILVLSVWQMLPNNCMTECPEENECYSGGPNVLICLKLDLIHHQSGKQMLVDEASSVFLNNTSHRPSLHCGQSLIIFRIPDILGGYLCKSY